MYLIRYTTTDSVEPRVGVLDGDSLAELAVPDMATLLRLPLAELRQQVEAAGYGAMPERIRLLPPVDGRTEVWASGVTYLRSREARIQESSQQTVYELVYQATRPELFFKAAAWRVVTDGDPVAIRSDSAVNVPEPELAVVIGAHGGIVGYLICNDMSSRTLEGENPLYLPQAKTYAGACALSPGIRPVWELDAGDLTVDIEIDRSGVTVFSGRTSTANIRRPLPELVTYLFHSENFPDGAVLSTGTGIVPEVDFTLRAGDVVKIGIDGLGELSNFVVIGKEHFSFQAEVPTPLG